MKTTVINFIGAPSCGKSLMAALIFSELKMMHKQVEYVQEYVKDLIWKELFDMIQNQYHVSMEQYKMIKSVDGKVSFVCTDSPLLIGLFYNRFNPDNVSNIQKTEEMILSKINEFNNIYIFLQRNEEYPFEKAGRIHDEKESNEIHDKLVDLLKEFKVEHLYIKSDKKNVSKILEYILANSI
jgi:hypothetical protein